MVDLSRRDVIKAGLATSAALATPAPLAALLRDQAKHAPEGTPANQRRIDLSGTWRFHRDDAKTGLTERWFAGALPAATNGPSSMALPGTTDEAGAGLPNPKPPTLDGLYRPNQYTGPAWYQREVLIPADWQGKSLSLFLERTHWVTRAWLDGQALGSHDSLISPHVYDLGTGVKPGTHLLTLCVDNTLLFDLGRFVSVYYEGTQTNWNGIIGRIELLARDAVFIDSLQVYPDVDRRAALVKLTIRNAAAKPVSGQIHLRPQSPTGTGLSPVSVDFSCDGAEAALEKLVPMGPDIQLWDEFHPALYTMRGSLVTHSNPAFHDTRSAVFGMRKLEIKGMHFTLNGRPLLLRGTLECGIFPLTAYPPTDVDSWRRIYQIEKTYGLNFIRFHSWTPPEAAFTAADIEGMFIQTEGPQANVQTGAVPERDTFVEQELLRIVDTYGNHPSFTTMTIGNEFGGSLPVITHWVDLLLARDHRHFYSSASSNNMVSPNRQFTETASMRGVRGPGTTFDYDVPMAKEDRPVIGHEIGQWTFFPDLDEARKYTGVLKAENFAIVARDLDKKGMRDESRRFLEATGKQAILLYKDEIEAMRRTGSYAGFSLLDLHDYPGQGTALIGLLDPFWDSKGLVSPAEHARYAGPVAPLLRFEKRAYMTSEKFEGVLDLSNFGTADLNGVVANWTVTSRAGVVVASGALAPATAPTGQLSRMGSFTLSFDQANAPDQLTITVSLAGTPIANSWDIWIYPATLEPQAAPDLVLARTWDSAAKAALAQGKKVILFPSSLAPDRTLKGSFEPVFWSPIWFHHDPATMGVLVNPDHPLFARFPTDFYSDWQWLSLIEGSRSVILDDTPLAYRPLVQIIDNFARNHRLGTVFEARAGAGRLLVCTLHLSQDEPARQTPEQRQFLHSLYDYASSAAFAPEQELTTAVLDRLFGGIAS
jgi:hypothetical protein